MDDKTQVISYIKEQIAKGVIAESDLGSLVGKEDKKDFFSKNMTNIMYVIGAIIVLIGVIILFVMHWNDISLLTKLASTIGVGLIAYIAAITIRSSGLRILSQVLFLVAAVLGNIGVFIMLDQADINFTLMVQFIVAAIFAGMFAFAYYVNRRNILPIIIIGFMSWAYYTLILEIMSSTAGTDVLKYATMLLGASYGLISYGFSKKMNITDADDVKEKNFVASILYFFGTAAFLGAGMTIGGAFDFIQILLIFGLFYLSIYLRKKTILLVSALFLMAHIIKISVEYFVDTAGWPITLIISGIAVIAIGVVTHRLSSGMKEGK